MTVMQDLEQLKAVYREIIRDMEERGINIWDDIYPCEFFADDIKKKRLYVLTDGEEIAKMSGAKYLRLFAADINKPAICLYEKSGFRKADGIYDMVFDDGFVLHGAGYEFFV